MTYIYDRDEVYVAEGDTVEYAPCSCTYKEFHHKTAEVVRIWQDGPGQEYMMELRLLESVTVNPARTHWDAGRLVTEVDWYCTDDEDPDDPMRRFNKVAPLLEVPTLTTVEEAEQWLDEANKLIRLHMKGVSSGAPVQTR
jgi:hypothetical protein